MTEDPIGIAGGANLYGYCENNPVMEVDPLGLESGDPVSRSTLYRGIRFIGGLLSRPVSTLSASSGGRSTIVIHSNHRYLQGTDGGLADRYIRDYDRGVNDGVRQACQGGMNAMDAAGQAVVFQGVGCALGAYGKGASISRVGRYGHAELRIAQNSVSEGAVMHAIRNGRVFFDPKEESYVFVLEK